MNQRPWRRKRKKKKNTKNTKDKQTSADLKMVTKKLIKRRKKTYTETPQKEAV